MSDRSGGLYLPVLLFSGVRSRPLEHLSDETLRLLVENARQLKESDSVVVDGNGKVITE